MTETCRTKTINTNIVQKVGIQICVHNTIARKLCNTAFTLVNFKTVHPIVLLKARMRQTHSEHYSFYSLIISAIYFDLKVHHQVEHKNNKGLHLKVNFMNILNTA